MSKNIFLIAIIASLLISCGTATSPDSKASIPMNITGGGTFALGAKTTIAAYPAYSGTGTLTYKWTENGKAAAYTTSSVTYSATVPLTLRVTIEVTDGTLTGSGSTTIIWQ